MCNEEGLGAIATFTSSDTEIVGVVTGLPDVPGPVTPADTPLSYTLSVMVQVVGVDTVPGAYVVAVAVGLPKDPGHVPSAHE